MNNVSQPAFAPEAGKTVNLGVTNASQAVQVRTNTNARERHCRIFNSSGVTVFVDSGASGITATLTTSMPVPAGAVEIISLAGDFVAAIAAVAGPSTVYFTPGEGL